MTKIRIIVGSETGTSLDVADAIEETLKAQGLQVEVADNPKLSDLTADSDEVLLICTSSTGAGELPTNIRPMYGELLATPPNIASRRYGVISLGDSSYETFGAAAKILDAALEDIGAIRVGEPLQIDAMETFEPEKEALVWVAEWIQLL
ncbi:flavodoxin domain-containing protein [Porticoccaceae bacterium LTM1]|nr:flavodoxin domain-containing protein [Porticoccaceae bacterium LTM1]